MIFNIILTQIYNDVYTLGIICCALKKIYFKELLLLRQGAIYTNWIKHQASSSH